MDYDIDWQTVQADDVIWSFESTPLLLPLVMKLSPHPPIALESD